MQVNGKLERFEKAASRNSKKEEVHWTEEDFNRCCLLVPHKYFRKELNVDELFLSAGLAHLLQDTGERQESFAGLLWQNRKQISEFYFFMGNAGSLASLQIVSPIKSHSNPPIICL